MVSIKTRGVIRTKTPRASPESLFNRKGPPETCSFQRAAWTVLFAVSTGANFPKYPSENGYGDLFPPIAWKDIPTLAFFLYPIRADDGPSTFPKPFRFRGRCSYKGPPPGPCSHHPLNLLFPTGGRRCAASGRPCDQGQAHHDSDQLPDRMRWLKKAPQITRPAGDCFQNGS